MKKIKAAYNMLIKNKHLIINGAFTASSEIQLVPSASDI